MPARTCVIPNDKLTRYLLNLAHERGRSRAEFFLERGFSASDLPAFAEALFEHAEANWPGLALPQPWGDPYELIGPLDCPDGTTPGVPAVWKIEAGEPLASLVTAYPNRSIGPGA